VHYEAQALEPDHDGWTDKVKEPGTSSSLRTVAHNHFPMLHT